MISRTSPIFPLFPPGSPTYLDLDIVLKALLKYNSHNTCDHSPTIKYMLECLKLSSLFCCCCCFTASSPFKNNLFFSVGALDEFNRISQVFFLNSVHSRFHLVYWDFYFTVVFLPSFPVVVLYYSVLFYRCSSFTPLRILNIFFFYSIIHFLRSAPPMCILNFDL